MPNYVYQCDCGYREEVTHSMDSDVTVFCSYCNISMQRKPQVAHIEFKGTGWASRETR